MSSNKTNTKQKELIAKFNKVAGHRIDTQKPVGFLYTNNELAVKDMKKTIPFTVAPQITKYLGIRLTKEVRAAYSEKYKTQMKETERNGKPSHAHGEEEPVLLKCPCCPKQSTGLVQSLSQEQHFSQTRTANANICLGPQKTLASQGNLEKEEGSQKPPNARFPPIRLSASDQFCVVLAQKQAHQSMKEDRKPRSKPVIVRSTVRPTYDEGGKDSQWGRTVSSTNGAGKPGQPHAEE